MIAFDEDGRFVLMGDVDVKKKNGWVQTALCCTLLLLILTQLTFAAADRSLEERLAAARRINHYYVTYDLDELGMSIDILREYTVFTRDTPAGDPGYELYGVSKVDMDSVMESNNIYLDALSPNADKEIIVTKFDGFPEGYSFDILSDEELSDVPETIKSIYEAAGLTVHKSEVYSHAQLKFIKTYCSIKAEGQTAYEVQYCTICDTKAISILLRSSAEISSAAEKEFQLLINRTDFWNAKTAIKTPSFLYTDTEFGVSFTVPENWTQAPLDEPRQVLGAKFVPNSADRILILFTRGDIYGNEEFQNALTPIGKKLLSRSDITGIVPMSEKDIAESIGVQESDVTMVTHGSKDYFSASTVISTTVNGAEISLPATYRICLENGYLYIFQFFGPVDSPYFADFETLMNSVEYPAISSDSADISDGYFQESSLGDITFLSLIVGLVSIVSIYTLPIVIYRYEIVKKPVNKKKAKRIVVIYGICAFLVMNSLIIALNERGAASGAIFLWSWVNYKILTGGKDNSNDAEEPFPGGSGPSEEAVVPSAGDGIEATAMEPMDTDPIPATVFCRWCGTQIPAESGFCHKCGKKLRGDDIKDDRLL